jgi:predicted acylesterase/phospholipase RssA
MNHFQIYAKKLVRNLPKQKQKQQKTWKKQNQTQTIDLILDGGAFNGSYLLGVVYFLREMESQKRLQVDRISCSSIGTFVALAHIGDCMDLFSTILYKKTRKHFKTHFNLDAFDETFEELRKHLPPDICERMTGKVFMAYNNIKKGKKVIKSKFHSVDDIFETIRRSCFVPFFINGNATYKNKYMDGFNPHFFNDAKKKTLYIDLFGYDKILNIMNIKNEKNNDHRVLAGLLDIHMFFVKERSTSMCSYVEEWMPAHHLHFSIKKTIECVIIAVIYLLQLFFIKTTLFKSFSCAVGKLNKLILKEHYV